MPAFSPHGSGAPASRYRDSCADVLLVSVTCVTRTAVNSNLCVQHWPSHHCYRCPLFALGLIPERKEGKAFSAGKRNGLLCLHSYSTFLECPCLTCSRGLCRWEAAE